MVARPQGQVNKNGETLRSPCLRSRESVAWAFSKITRSSNNRDASDKPLRHRSGVIAVMAWLNGIDNTSIRVLRLQLSFAPSWKHKVHDSSHQDIIHGNKSEGVIIRAYTATKARASSFEQTHAVTNYWWRFELISYLHMHTRWMRDDELEWRSRFEDVLSVWWIH